MATLDELMQIKGVVAAGEFTPTGELVDFKSSMSMPQHQAGMTAQRECDRASGATQGARALLDAV